MFGGWAGVPLGRKREVFVGRLECSYYVDRRDYANVLPSDVDW